MHRRFDFELLIGKIHMIISFFYKRIILLVIKCLPDLERFNKHTLHFPMRKA